MTKLQQSRFLERAPAEVVNRERQRLVEYTGNLEKLQASLGMLES